MNTTYEDFRTSYSAADALPEERASFIRRTYLHLAGAVLVFILLEGYLLTTEAALRLTQTMLGTQYSWLIVLGIFMGVSMLANWWANSQTSKPLQYMGLAIFVVAEAIIFLPLLFIAANYGGRWDMMQAVNRMLRDRPELAAGDAGVQQVVRGLGLAPRGGRGHCPSAGVQAL